MFYFIKHAYTSRLDTFTTKNKQTNKIFSCKIHDFIKKKNITTKIQRISPWCSAADSSINSRHNNFTFSHVLTFQSIRRFVAICKRKQICFCKMVTEWKLLSSYSYLFLKGLRVSSIVRERRQREEEYSCQSWSQVATLTRIWNSRRKILRRTQKMRQ